jgi:peptidoglycan hydrolase-like protein with peptidoglycan-binding domain
VSVRQIQVRLSRAGFYHGRIDGVMGPRTRSAMRAYKQSHNRRVTQR